MEQCSPSLHRPTHRVTQRMSGEGKVVCVTGGSGYIASWLVNFLLQKGYTVNATVRDPSQLLPSFFVFLLFFNINLIM